MNDRPLRIVLVNEGLWGGSGRVVTWLASRLANNGHFVTLIVRSSPATDRYDLDPRISTVRFPRTVRSAQSKPTQGKATTARTRGVFKAVARALAGERQRRFLTNSSRAAKRISLGILYGYRDLQFGRNVRETVEQCEANVLVSFVRGTNVAVLLGMKGSPVPVIVSERSQPFAYKDLDPIRSLLRPPLYRRAAAVVVLTEEIASLAERRWAIPRPIVLPNALMLLPPRPLPKTTRRPKSVLCVGRLHEHKDHLTLIEAWQHSLARTHGWQLTILGEGPLKLTLEAAVAQLGVGDSVSLPGASRDVLPYYLDASVFVLPSILEGFPNALLEAMACGCACVASDCPGAVREMLDSGNAGLLVPMRNPSALAAALDRITSDETLRQHLCDAALSRTALYSADRVLSLWDSVLRASAETV